jgi:Flp pilus assembly protein TadD
MRASASRSSPEAWAALPGQRQGRAGLQASWGHRVPTVVFVDGCFWHGRLNDAVSINRHVAQPHHGLGLLAEREGRAEDAIARYLEALAVDPGFVPSRANLARVYFDQGRLELARAAWSWLALSQLMQGRALEAVRSAQQALALDRDDALATYVLAMALSSRRDPSARGWLERAMTLAPGVPALHYALSRHAK